MKNRPFLTTSILLALAFTNSCFSGSSKVFTDTRDGQTYITDARDGKAYKVVKIGEQIWMAENLNYKAKENANYRPNRSICYENDESNCEKYGRLYRWNTAKIACPSGWRLSKNEEWQKLADFAGGRFTAGEKLKAKSGWKDDGNGTDEYGFAALPGRVCYSSGNCRSVDSQGNFDSQGSWWTATQFGGFSPPATLQRSMYYDNGRVSYLDNSKESFISIRCIKK